MVAPVEKKKSGTSALVSNIQGYSVHDGPGIRTTVFLKGCGLACLWCSNPENISFKQEVGFIASLCTHCGTCAEACPEGAINFENDEDHINRELCTRCGKCAPVCSYKALATYGNEMTVAEVFDVVKRDKMFYDRSGGGITVSGGEPVLRRDFVRALLAECRAAGIGTCIETSGYAPSADLLTVLPVTDHVLYDLKHMNTGEHARYTGHPNDLIKTNAKLLVDSGVEFLFRIPLIPGVNDGPQNIHETVEFLKSLGNRAQRLELMPYHRLGEGKYRALKREYAMHDLRPMEPDRAEEVRQAFEEGGVECSVSR
jgi:pyruvate formate lyase activating enzyme